MLRFLAFVLLLCFSAGSAFASASLDPFSAGHVLIRVQGTTSRVDSAKINGVPLAIGKDGSFKGEIRVPSGAKEISVELKDKAGKVSRLAKSITIARDHTFMLSQLDGVRSFVTIGERLYEQIARRRGEAANAKRLDDFFMLLEWTAEMIVQNASPALPSVARMAGGSEENYRFDTTRKVSERDEIRIVYDRDETAAPAAPAAAFDEEYKQTSEGSWSHRRGPVTSTAGYAVSETAPADVRAAADETGEGSVYENIKLDLNESVKMGVTQRLKRSTPLGETYETHLDSSTALSPTLKILTDTKVRQTGRLDGTPVESRATNRLEARKRLTTKLDSRWAYSHEDKTTLAPFAEPPAGASAFREPDPFSSDAAEGEFSYAAHKNLKLKTGAKAVEDSLEKTTASHFRSAEMKLPADLTLLAEHSVMNQEAALAGTTTDRDRRSLGVRYKPAYFKPLRVEMKRQMTREDRLYGVALPDDRILTDENLGEVSFDLPFSVSLVERASHRSSRSEPDGGAALSLPSQTTRFRHGVAYGLGSRLGMEAVWLDETLDDGANLRATTGAELELRYKIRDDLSFSAAYNRRETAAAEQSEPESEQGWFVRLKGEF